MIEKIKQLSENLFEEIRDIRRYIHQNPELSFQENKTSEFIKQKLDEYGIKYKSGYVKTGILGIIEGKKKGKVVALRTDIDALPIEEKNSVEYKSKNKGVMHACGHDVHLASLLGSAKILYELKNEFAGTILLIFQPAEEKLPGGAKLMLEEGIFDEIKPDLIIGQHVMPTMKIGQVGFKEGMYMASTDEIYISVTGKGGHAAMSYQITDTVLIASHIIVALQQIVSRNAKSDVPSVLSFGKVIANGATNIIPNQVKIEGTMRTMNEEWRKQMQEKIVKIAKFTAEAMGGKCEVEIISGYPALINNEKITKQASNFAKQYLGNNNVEDMDIRMTAEDFAYFSQEYPATFYRLGTMNKEKGIINPLHSENFDIDENALKHSSGLMAWLAYKFLTE